MRLAPLCGPLVLCLGCHQYNPEFDPSTNDEVAGTESAGTETTAGTETVGTETIADTGSETIADTGSETIADTGDTSLMCEFMPRDGLALSLMGPEGGGNCPGEINAWMVIASAGGGQATLRSCTLPECGGTCTGEHPLSAFPLSISDYLPDTNLDHCLYVEARNSLGTDGTHCFWGAITIQDGIYDTPRVIAVAHSTPPTPTGAEALGDTIPAPEDGGACNCEAIGQGTDCCYMGDSPSFWYWNFAGEHIYPLGFYKFMLDNPLGLTHFFKPFQAQKIGDCDAEVQLSWAVVATP